MNQLKMFFTPGEDPEPATLVPDGFEVRELRPDEAVQYIALRPLSGFGEWTLTDFENYRATSGKRILVAVEKATGNVAAAASAESSATEGHGQLGWVMCNPAYRGKRLGVAVSAAATRALIELGFKKCYLLTDDWRVPALRIYLQMGWHPDCAPEGMAERWEAIGNLLSLPIHPAQ